MNLAEAVGEKVVELLQEWFEGMGGNEENVELKQSFAKALEVLIELRPNADDAIAVKATQLVADIGGDGE